MVRINWQDLLNRKKGKAGFFCVRGSRYVILTKGLSFFSQGEYGK